jgi:hypothetical protein
MQARPKPEEVVHCAANRKHENDSPLPELYGE